MLITQTFRVLYVILTVFTRVSILLFVTLARKSHYRERRVLRLLKQIIFSNEICQEVTAVKIDEQNC